MALPLESSVYVIDHAEPLVSLCLMVVAMKGEGHGPRRSRGASGPHLNQIDPCVSQKGLCPLRVKPFMTQGLHSGRDLTPW